MKLKGYKLARNRSKQTLMSFILVLFLTNIYGQVVINEINYRSVALQQDIDFVELHNAGSASVDLTDWQLTDGISYKFPAGTSISAGGYAVVCANPSDCQSVLGFSGAYGPYSGALSGEGDDVVLRNQLFKEVDKVDYESWKEWPNVRFDDYETIEPIPQDTSYTQSINIKVPISIQKINPNLDGSHAGSWEAASPTPNAENSVYNATYINIPVIKDVSKSPDKPISGEEVNVEADFDDYANYASILSVTLEYQTMSAGSYIAKSDNAYQSGWTPIEMLDDGAAADADANNGVYTATIPASVQVDRTLVRYRVKVTTSNGFSQTYPDQNHTESNYAYYVYDGDEDFNGNSFSAVNPMQDITIITKQAITDEYIGRGSTDTNGLYRGYDYLGEGTLIYNGKIYDHIRFRPRGKTRGPRIKPGIKFDMNSERKIQLVDDCGKEYDVSRGKLVLSGTWVNDAASHGLVESLVHKIMELTGGMYKSIDYTSMRIVDEATETGKNGDFWGIYLISEEYDSDLLEEHKLPDGNIWTTYDPPTGGAAARFSYVDDYGDFVGATTQTPWQTGANIRTIPDTTNLNKGMFYGDWIANEFWANGERNYVRKHSYREYYNPLTNKWHGWCKDYDGSFGSGNNVSAVSTTATAHVDTFILQPLLMPTSLRVEYEGELRSAYDLLLNPEQSDFLVDSELKKIYDPSAAYDWTTLDHSRWDTYQTYPEGDVHAHFKFYKNWFRDRADYILNNSTHGIADDSIPVKPNINLIGNTNLDNLVFSNSSFSDADGNGTFAALEWRAGEWSDPSNPIYDDKCEAKYEIETKWQSGEITNFSGSFTIPADAQLKVGRTYKVRVRYKDNTDRWSHWSDAVKIVPTPAASANYDIVINEIMYNDDADCCGDEYVEIYNKSNTTVDLSNFKFTDGVDYDFSQGASIAANGYLVLAKDSIQFTQKYGFSPYGDYKGSLDNDGETITLSGPFRTFVDSVLYNDANPWDKLPDGGGPSLELLDTSLDNDNPISWFRSDNLCGTPGAANSRTCASTTDRIVINEINYNSDNDSYDPGDWVELHNPNASAVDISNWEFYDGDSIFVIPVGTTIAAGDYLVLVENASLFTSAFASPSSAKYLGNFTFGLSNKGERISLFNENKCLVDYVPFDDKQPWPEEPDGDGPTLSLTGPNYDNALPQSWESSGDFGSAYGTPGRENVPCIETYAVLPISTCTDIPLTFQVDNVHNGMTYFWQFIGATPPIATTSSAQATWTTPGIKTVQLITTYEECTKVQNYQIDINCAVSDTYTTPEDVALNATISGTVASSTTILLSDVSNGTLTLNPNGNFDYTPDADYHGTDQFIQETCAGIPADTVFHVSAKSFVGQVATSTDDAEEEPDGSMYFDSSDLEFMTDNNRGDMIAVGLRITNVDIPKDAVITNAYLQFVADEADTISTSLTIKAEAVGNAPAFIDINNNISAKYTTNSIAWNNLPDWIIAETYDSPDITNIVEELTNENDWASGNAMTFIIEGTGQRVAESFDGSPTLATKLIVNYESLDSMVITPSTFNCTTSIVEINITPVNDTPLAVDDTQTTTEDTPVTGSVISNDSDIENDALSVNTTPVVSPANGTLVLNADGACVYTPNADFNGIDTFEYEICDNGNPVECDTAMVTITIDAVNDLPVATSDIYTINEDNTLSNNILSNDSDIENGTLTVSTPPVTPPANGILILNADGTFEYIPNANFNGTDTFEYEVCDDGTPIACNTATVDITIAPINDAPIAVDDYKSTPEETLATGNALANDINVDDDNITVYISFVTSPTNGSGYITSTGTYNYTPDADFSGTDTFEYRVCDNGSPILCDTATVTITIDDVNDMPLPVADTINMSANTTAQLNVLLNDTDPENNNLTIATAPAVAPGSGTLNMQANGDVDYTPAPGFVGTITFSYQVCDDGTPVECTTAEVVINVALDCIELQLFAWMEGPYDSTAYEMNNALNVARSILPGQIPTSSLVTPTPPGQPYNVAPWNYTGTEGATWTDDEYVPDMVDWVLVSIRTDVAKSTEIAQTAGIINKDGSITFPDRCGFDAVVGVDSVYAMIEHRNHIGIMTPEPIEIVNGVLTFDFRTSDSFRDPTSFGQKQLTTGEWAMYAGDCNQVADFPSYDITGSDKSLWISNNGIFDTYLNTDLNLDGDVNGQDKTLWFENNGISSRVPK